MINPHLKSPYTPRTSAEALVSLESLRTHLDAINLYFTARCVDYPTAIRAQALEELMHRAIAPIRHATE